MEIKAKMRIDEAAALAGVSKRTIYRRISAQQLPTVGEGSQRRILREDFVRINTREPQPGVTES